MKIGLWSSKHNHKLKKIIDEHASSTRRTEEEIQKDIKHIKKAEGDKDHAKIEEYLKKELGLEEKDFEELEDIKHYVEVVEENKLKELKDDEEIIEKLKDKHELSHEHAHNLMHKIRLIRSYLRAKSVESRKLEEDISFKTMEP